MKKSIKSLIGVALALVMCLTMAPTATAKADEAVALSEYTEEQLLTAFMGEWDVDGYVEHAILSRNHIKVWDSVYDLELGKTVEQVYVDTDWTYEGLVEVETKLTYEDWEAWMNRYIYLEKVDGTWVDRDGNVYDEKDVTKTEGEIEGVFVDYVDGAWKDDDGNVYAEESLDYIYGEIELRLDIKTKALKFTGSGYVVHLYVEYNERFGVRGLRMQYTNETTEHNGSIYLLCKIDEDYTSYFVDELLEASLTATETPVEEPTQAPTATPAPTVTPAEEPAEEPTTPVETETPVEEPKAEEPTETPVEEPKTEEPTETPDVETEDKEIIEKTKDGREVYTGETVYIVKKGDCLWSIAKQLLGNGARYKELFTRNNGIIEKAKLIFPGQEVIVPAQ